MKLNVSVIALLTLVLCSSGAWGRSHKHQVIAPDSQALPNHQLTPGVTNPDVTQANIGKTICRHGYTKTIRPSSYYTDKLKRRQIRAYGYTDRKLGHYEEDHLISLELGGSPTSGKNLWPEPHYTASGWGSYTKDRLENKLKRMVCHHKISLQEAQRDEAGNWIAAYKKYIGKPPHRHIN